MSVRGYIFIDWKTTSSGNGAAYAGGNSDAMDAAMTLYADWDPNVHLITYDDNGTENGTVSKDGSHGYDESVTVSRNIGGLYLLRLQFSEWNTAANGSGTTYEAGMQFLMSDLVVTLYAYWASIDIQKTGDNSHIELCALRTAFTLAGLILMRPPFQKPSSSDR